MALFKSEAGEILQSLESGVMSLESGRGTAACIEELFRNAHNLKGMSGAMGFDHVVEASHAHENVLDRCRTAINVMGDINVSCLLDGKEREIRPETAPAPPLTQSSPTTA